MITQCRRLQPRLVRKQKHKGIDPSTVLALFTAENTADGVFKPEKRISLKTTSPAGASGIGQIMPATLAGLKSQGWLDKNTDYGTLAGQVKAMVAAVKQTQKAVQHQRSCTHSYWIQR